MLVSGAPAMSEEWLEHGERHLGVVGDGYLQGVLLSQVSASRVAVATERRIVMLEGAELAGDGWVRSGRVCLGVPWAMVHGMWRGVMPFPPELWRQGPEGDVVVFALDPTAAAGRDLVICSNTDAWATAARSIGIAEIHD